MSHILVSGLINVETTVRVDGFPIAYSPVRYPFFGVQSRVSGVGYNVSKALTTLGNEVDFLSLVGQDAAALQVRHALEQDHIPARYVLSEGEQTAQSVILYDDRGRRQINVDLKDIQERVYPPEQFNEAMSQADLLVLCNINFSRPFLAQGQQAGKPIATDVHTIGDLHDAYNSDFMRHATILFQSDEHLPTTPENWVRELWRVYGTEIAVVGLGAQGALLGVRRDNFLERFPAVMTRPIVNSIGAGDALFSAFIHTYTHTPDPILALRKAIVFASYKIGTASAADGFLDEAGLNEWYERVAGG